MIYATDLHLATVLCNYMKYGGYPVTLHTDCLSFAHILKRTTEATINTVLQETSRFLDYVFILGLRKGTLMEPSDMRLYMRVYVASRLPLVVQLWNTMSTTREFYTYDKEYENSYDLIESSKCKHNEVYLYFRNASNHIEPYYTSASDLLKYITLRRTIHVQTLLNSPASEIQKVVFLEPDDTTYTEQDTQPIKVYTNNEVDLTSFKLLSGKLKLK